MLFDADEQFINDGLIESTEKQLTPQERLAKLGFVRNSTGYRITAPTPELLPSEEYFGDASMEIDSEWKLIDASDIIRLRRLGVDV